MSIRFQCSECYEALKISDNFAGRNVRCPNCNGVNRVPFEVAKSAEEHPISDSRSSARSSGSAQSQSGPSRRSRTRDDDLEELLELPQLSKRKKKVAKTPQSDSGGGVPLWAIVTGSSLAGVLLIGVIAFIVMKPRVPASKTDVATSVAEQPAAAAAPANVVQAQADGNGAKFRMKWEMPLKWTSEGGIEKNMWPWATMKGQGQVIRLSTNRSLLGGAETMTTQGGHLEQLKTSHTMRGTKLQAENNDWVDGPLNVHQGKNGPVVWSEYEYKGVIGKGYGIRCTVDGVVLPCTLMLECGQSARDKWRPTLLAIAESIHFVRIKANGEEGSDDLSIEMDDEQ